MPKIENAYTYFLQSSNSRKSSKYDSHSKNDLKKVYTKMIQVNKNSPLFKLTEPSTAKRFAIDIKESSRNLLHIVASLSENEDINSCFEKNVAYSSNPIVAKALFTGESSLDNGDSFYLCVNSLAKPQINTGNYLKDNNMSLPIGNYSFDLKTQSATYEFQFSVKLGEDNLSVQRKLVNLINSAHIGVEASLVSDDDNKHAIRISSINTGVPETGANQFNIFPSSKANDIAVMNILGISNVTQSPTNANFTINDDEYSTTSNSFSLDNGLEIELLKEGKNSTSKIGFKNNFDAIFDNVTNLTTAYNNMLTLAQKYATIPNRNTNRSQFFINMASVSTSMKSQLDSIGLEVSDNGYVFVNDILLEDAISSENIETTFATLNNFKNSIGNKADDISINPFAYMDRIIYEYKPPYNNFPTPYLPSSFVGLFLDNYI